MVNFTIYEIATLATGIYHLQGPELFDLQAKLYQLTGYSYDLLDILSNPGKGITTRLVSQYPDLLTSSIDDLGKRYSTFDIY